MLPNQHRETARVLLLDPDGLILLFLTHFDPEVGLPPRWITPGGGIEEGETRQAAAARELAEETGLSVEPKSLGSPIWQTSGIWQWGDQIHQHSFEDTFFELRTAQFKPNQSGWTDDERRDVLEIRWWSLPELMKTDDLIGPPGLAEFLKSHLGGN